MNYQEELEDYKKVVSIAEKVCSSLPDPTNFSHKNKWAYHLFVHLIKQSQSILKLLPDIELSSTRNRFLIGDLSSIASLTRNLTETYEMFYYLGIDDIEQEEVYLRWMLMKLHEISELEEIGKNLGGSLDHIEAKKKEKENLRNAIKRNEFYLKISKIDENNIYKFIRENNEKFYRHLKNKKGRCLASNEIKKKMLYKVAGDKPLNQIFIDIEKSEPLDIELVIKRFNGIFTYFSNHTHASCLSVSEMIYEDQIGDDTKHVFYLRIRHGMFYLGMATFDMIDVFSTYNLDENIQTQDTHFMAKKMIEYLYALKITE